MGGHEHILDSAPKAIIFDCWNTLFTAKPKEDTATRVSHAILHHRFNYRILKTIERDLMLGRQDDLKVPARRILRDMHLPPVAPLVNQVEKVMLKALERQQPFPETIEVLQQLRKRYKLAMISNTFYQSFESLRHKFHLNDYFDVIIPSYEVGAIKPDRKIFKIALDRLNVSAGDALMVGDNWHDDVEAAERMGINAILIDRGNRWPEAKGIKIKNLRQIEQKIPVTQLTASQAL